MVSMITPEVPRMMFAEPSFTAPTPVLQHTTSQPMLATGVPSWRPVSWAALRVTCPPTSQGLCSGQELVLELEDAFDLHDPVTVLAAFVDLGVHVCRVCVELPGEVVAHPVCVDAEVLGPGQNLWLVFLHPADDQADVSCHEPVGCFAEDLRRPSVGDPLIGGAGAASVIPEDPVPYRSPVLVKEADPHPLPSEAMVDVSAALGLIDH
jgi:hypothetical protein